MNYASCFRNGVCVFGCAVLIGGALRLAEAQEKSIEEQTKVHRLESSQRAIFDAFTYVNRIPEVVEEDESPLQLAGRIFGRLGNQEGRILLKLPPGMDKESYLAFKTFYRYEGEQAGNCAACHVPRDFSDALKHVVTKGGSPTATPSLRNLKERKIDLKKVLLGKIAASKEKRSGKADEIDDAYAPMSITAEDVPGLVAFLNLLNDTPEEGFRDLILNAELLDTTDFWE